MSDEYVSRDYLLGEYDRQHQGPPGGARKIIAEAPAADVVERPRWIPVTERLPEDDQRVLAYYGFDRGDGYLGMMFMQVLDYFARDPRPHFQHEGANGMMVTHWMPLPEPPEGAP